jgi:hypothetical protein
MQTNEYEKTFVERIFIAHNGAWRCGGDGWLGSER